jgi:DNA-binding beta-propeller fold protein YncE
MMMRKPRLFMGAALMALVAALGVGANLLDNRAVAAKQAGVEAPMFEVDPFWPKPLPNHWILGSTIGVSVDSRDHVWIIHRQTTFDERTEINAAVDPPTAACCIPAPNVLKFDPAGNLVGHWGGPGEGFDWPQSNHGITVDHKDNVWIGGNGQEDSHLLKFSRDGTFLMQIGRAGQLSGSNSTENFWRVAKIAIDAEANEAYIADGYGNKRVAVVDADTGDFKRYWGAYGNKPDDAPLPPYSPDAPPAQQFRSPMHCAELSNDGFVYACDRASDRIQVFEKDGTFVKEGFIRPETLGSGSVWDIAFSRDPEQTFIYLADGFNKQVHIILRETLEVLTSFGDGGRQPGQFFGVHSIATDSEGNIYTTETYEGKRLQKFVYKGLGPVTETDQGVLWPSPGRN